MSDGKLEKMDKDFSPQVDALLPETEALAKVQNGKLLLFQERVFVNFFFFSFLAIIARQIE
jgi:hypothetical protein